MPVSRIFIITDCKLLQNFIRIVSFLFYKLIITLFIVQIIRQYTFQAVDLIKMYFYKYNGDIIM